MSLWPPDNAAELHFNEPVPAAVHPPQRNPPKEYKRREDPPRLKIRRIPFQQRACFICGSRDACEHREPELVITVISESF